VKPIDVTSRFPRPDLRASRYDESLQAREARAVEAAQRCGVTCPDCGDASRLSWFYFQSPAWTWQNLCGRAGVVAYCDEHDAQVGFLLDKLS
jgi:hypothetical protein